MFKRVFFAPKQKLTLHDEYEKMEISPGTHISAGHSLHPSNHYSMSAQSNTDTLVRKLAELELEYEAKRKAYHALGDDVGWRSARAWLDHLEDCIRATHQQLVDLGVKPQRRCVVWHD
jgi:hypothetical protein